MAIAYIDNTCLYAIADVLSRSAPDRSYEWAWKTSIETSCALISSENVRLAPSPTRDGPASGSFGQLTKGLSDFVGLAHSAPSVIADAKDATKLWTRRNSGLLLQSYELLKQDQDNFAHWLDWSLFNVWEEHSRRLNGLFDPEFIPDIAKVLNIPETDLRAAWAVSRDPEKAAGIAQKRDADGMFSMLCDAYVMSALVRGRYHDYLAQDNSWQIMHHPLRNGVFRQDVLEMAKDYHVANTELYFSNILMAAAFSESRSDRIDNLVANAIRARKAVRSGEIDLRPKGNDEVALSVAVQAAKSLDIRVHNQRIDQALGAASSLGLGTLASFSLTGWAGIIASATLGAAGITAQALSKNKDPARRVIGIYSTRGKRMRDLAKAGPGRIRRNWLSE